MRMLDSVELDDVSGGWMVDWMMQLEEAILRVPDVYQASITATADMMCIATGNC